MTSPPEDPGSRRWPAERLWPGARELIRADHRAAGRRIAVLDDDPTGSQTVHDVDVVLSLDPADCVRALTEPGSVCFALTNSRSLAEDDAYTVNHDLARGLLELLAAAGVTPLMISRSDSTLRGHLVAEIGALDAARREVTGTGYDGVLLVPAYLEAGRVTTGGTHWARLAGRYVPVGETEFAQDPAFGYRSSDLRDHVAERTGGRIDRRDVHLVTLRDIRDGGPDRVAEVLSRVSAGGFAVADALSYHDLDIVALGLLAAEAGGQALLPRTGPSFVRALGGIEPQPPLGSEQLGSVAAPGGHGLVVVGSHVGLTNRQLDVARRTADLVDVRLDASAVLDPGSAAEAVEDAAAQVRDGLARSDVLLVTSREIIAASGRDAALDVARTVSTAVADVVRAALPARPAWIVAKGGITSHDVAVRGLGMRRATVLGQLFPGVVSVFRPVEASVEAVGMPYVVFAGNVGDERALADVVRRLGPACA